MQRVTMVRYTAKFDRADENEALSRAVFEGLRGLRPEGMAYAVFRDGTDFVHVFINLAADDAGVLTSTPAFQAFAKGVGDRTVAAPDQILISAELVDSYGFQP